MSPKVSVLVPVYKVSDYIERCVESLFSQTFVDIEYIFVNDATPDDSIEKLLKTLERYPDRKKQVQIINHNTNKGIATTRNTALEASCGDYISVVDSDDYVESDMIEKLYQKAIAEDADIVIMDYIVEKNNGSAIVNEYISETNKYFDEFVVYDRFITVFWNKLIRRSLFIHPECKIPDGMNFLEDKHAVARMYFYATKIVKVDKAFYHYNKTNPAAITQTRNKSHFENVLLYWSYFDKFLYEHGVFEKYKPYLDYQKIKNKVSLLIDTDSYSLRKEYAGMFYDEETTVIKDFKRGQRLMLLLVRNKLFILAHLFHKILILKRDFQNLLIK